MHSTWNQDLERLYGGEAAVKQDFKSHSDDTAVKLLDWLRRLHQSEQLGLKNRKSNQGKTLEQMIFSLECKDVS
jgi:hypothetical protein